MRRQLQVVWHAGCVVVSTVFRGGFPRYELPSRFGEEKMERNRMHETTALRSLDHHELEQVEGGWCGTPVPGTLPIPEPDPWFRSPVIDMGRLGGIAFGR